MLKLSGGIESKTRPGEGRVGVGGSRARRGGSKLDNGRRVDSDEVGDDEVGTKVQKSFKFKKTKSDFLIPGARNTFTKLRQAYIKVLIFHHFDPECYIRVKTNASGYAIGRVFSQLTSKNLDQWHPVVLFLRKMIPAKTRYETHNGELLAIIEAFKTWRHYIEGSQHEVLVLIDYNNLHQFMETKSLNSR